MIYDIKKGYGLQLTKFDEQYLDTIIYRGSKREIIELADKILLTFNCKCELFADKFEIPAYFINLILSKYGMKVRGWENDIPRVGNKSK